MGFIFLNKLLLWKFFWLTTVYTPINSLWHYKHKIPGYYITTDNCGWVIPHLSCSTSWESLLYNKPRAQFCTDSCGSSQNRTKTLKITRESWSSPCVPACRWYHEDVSHCTEAHEVETDNNIIEKTCLTFFFYMKLWVSHQGKCALWKSPLPNTELFPLTSDDDVQRCKLSLLFFLMRFFLIPIKRSAYFFYL